MRGLGEEARRYASCNGRKRKKQWLVEPHTTLVAAARGILSGMSNCGSVRVLQPNRDRMIEEIEISQNDKCLMRTVAGIAPAATIIRIEKFSH